MTGNEDEPADTQAITSPLDHIRHEEAEVAGRLAAARRAIDERLAAAQEKAEELKEEARRAAQKEAKDRRAEIIARAEKEAEKILRQARQRAETLRQGVSEQQSAAVEQIVAMIAGMDEVQNEN
jgi:vacuolar-type H+-ATPase subunit H